MKAKLVVVQGNTSKREVQLKLPTVVGRSREADLTVPHPLISRRHCQVFEQDGYLMVHDLASLNGTMVGGRKILQAPLLPNAEFTIGPITFQVLYVYEGDPASLPAIEFAEVDDMGAEPAIEAEGSDLELPESPVSINESIDVIQPSLMAWADSDHEVEMPSIAPPFQPEETAEAKQKAASRPTKKTKQEPRFAQPASPRSGGTTPAPSPRPQPARNPPSTVPMPPTFPSPQYADGNPRRVGAGGAWSDPVEPGPTGPAFPAQPQSASHPTETPNAPAPASRPEPARPEPNEGDEANFDDFLQGLT